MSLTAVLVPMLALMGSFAERGVIETVVPAMGCCFGCDPPPFLLTLALFEGDIYLLGGDSLTEGLVLPADDLEALSEVLWELKQRHPDDENVIIVPESRASFEQVVAVMDASRSFQGSTLFPFATIASGAQ